MSRVTLASLREEIEALQLKYGSMEGSFNAQTSAMNAWRIKAKEAETEVLRLRLLASEMRGFIMAHHSSEHPEGGQTLYKEPYGDTEDNKVEMPEIRYPFMDVDIG